MTSRILPNRNEISKLSPRFLFFFSSFIISSANLLPSDNNDMWWTPCAEGSSWNRQSERVDRQADRAATRRDKRERQEGRESISHFRADVPPAVGSEMGNTCPVLLCCSVRTKMVLPPATAWPIGSFLSVASEVAALAVRCLLRADDSRPHHWLPRHPSSHRPAVTRHVVTWSSWVWVVAPTIDQTSADSSRIRLAAIWGFQCAERIRRVWRSQAISEHSPLGWGHSDTS